MEDTVFIPIYQLTPDLNLEQSTLQVENPKGSFSIGHLNELQSCLLCYKTVIPKNNETPADIDKRTNLIRNLLSHMNIRSDCITDPHTKADGPLCEECEQKLEFGMQNEEAMPQICEQVYDTIVNCLAQGKRYFDGQ